MEHRFVVVNNALFQSKKKRRTASVACDMCRKKKKRCSHYGRIDFNSDRNNTISEDVSHGVQSFEQQDETAEGTDRRPYDQSTSNSPSRFIGDLNPEAVFLREHDFSRRKEYIDTDVGLLLLRSSDKIKSRNLSHDVDVDSNDDNVNDNALTVDDFSREKTPIEVNKSTPVSNIECITSSSDTSHLIDIYFSTIHLLLPLVDEASFRSAYRENIASKSLVMAMILIASKDNMAGPFLRIKNTQCPLTPQAFGKKIYAILSEVLRHKMERDKITLIRVLGLLALYTEGIEGPEEASCNLALAIHHAQTIGLHLGLNRKDEKESDSLNSLFWCLWSLDRLNAAMNGRPVLLNDRDIESNVRDVWVKQKPSFGIWLRIAEILDTIISLYRPLSDRTVGSSGGEIIEFEKLVEQCNGYDLPITSLATLELFYHAVCMLSYRQRGPYEIVSTSSYVRQCASANKAVAIANTSLFYDLIALPVIPYSIALAFSVNYQHYRYSKLVTTRDVARRQLVESYDILKQLSKLWFLASVMKRLGHKAMSDIVNTASTQYPNNTVLDSYGDSRVGLASSSNTASVPFRALQNSEETTHSQISARNDTQEKSQRNLSSMCLADSDTVLEETRPPQYSTPNSESPCNMHDFDSEDIDLFFTNLLNLSTSDNSLMENMIRNQS
ncbi:hypothetical protein V1511DRAFT_324278 [Dipodascopsis uninucleata]